MKLKVTRKHIERAMGVNAQMEPISKSCPTAQALRDQFPDATEVLVGWRSATVWSANGVYREYRMSAALQDQVANWSHGEFRPGIYGITPKAESR